MAADVQPVAGKGVEVDRQVGLEQELHQVWEVQVVVALNKFQHLRFEDIDPHADQMCGGGFFWTYG